MFNRIRAAWRALFRSTTAMPVHAEVMAPEPRRGISMAAIWEAGRHSGSEVYMPEQTFARAEPMPGTLPTGMALDSMPGTADISAYAAQQAYHEGLGFLGYPYLAELSQRAEYRHVASIWAEHCTRKWIKIVGPDAKVKAIEAELQRLAVRELFREAIEKECFFGRVQIFMDFGDFDRPVELAAPLVMDNRKINDKRPLKRLAVVEPMWSYPGVYDAQNPLAPDFYKPASWYMSGRIVHASRLLTMVGRPMPNMLKPAYAFGGVALTQMCKPYVDNWLRARQSVSDLIHSFSVMVLATDMETVLGGGAADQLFNRVDLFNKTRDNRGTFVIDKNAELFSNVSAPVAGLDKLQAQALEQIASVSGIPLVILLGITPSGLNASSEGEIRVFYDKIMAYLEKVCGPELHNLLQVIQLSLFGDIDPKVTFEFESLWEMSDADKALIRKTDAEADGVYIDKGVIDPDESRARLNDEVGGMYAGALSGPAPGVPDDPFEDEPEPLASDSAPLRAAGVMCVAPDGRMLFLRRADSASSHPGTWCFPGGSIDAGEDEYEAACREMLEETGHDLDAPLGLPVTEYAGFATFRADVPDPVPVTLNDEHVAYVWAKPEHAPEPLHPGVRYTLDTMR